MRLQRFNQWKAVYGNCYCEWEFRLFDLHTCHLWMVVASHPFTDCVTIYTWMFSCYTVHRRWHGVSRHVQVWHSTLYLVLRNVSNRNTSLVLSFNYCTVYTAASCTTSCSSGFGYHQRAQYACFVVFLFPFGLFIMGFRAVGALYIPLLPSFRKLWLLVVKYDVSTALYRA